MMGDNGLVLRLCREATGSLIIFSATRAAFSRAWSNVADAGEGSCAPLNPHQFGESQ